MRFTWLTGGSDGKNGWTQFFQDLNPFPNNGVYNLGEQPIDGYRLFMMILGWASGGAVRDCSSGR